MGLENLPPNFLYASSLDQARDLAIQSGWKQTDYGFNLGRKTRALDINRTPARLLVYPTDAADLMTYQQLLAAEIPVLPVLSSVFEEATPLTAVVVSMQARALDSLTYPDQETQSGYLGSFEIMSNIAELLARVFRHTGRVPHNLQLNDLAIVPGNVHIIRLVPPLALDPTDKWEGIAHDLLRDLEYQDPVHNHKAQIQHFKSCFGYYLENEN